MMMFYSCTWHRTTFSSRALDIGGSLSRSGKWSNRSQQWLFACLFVFLFVLLVCDCPPAIGGEQAGLRFQLLDQQVSQSLNLNIYSRGLLNGLNMAKVANFKNPLFISIVIVNNLFHLKTDAQKWSRGWHNCFVDGAYVTPFISMFVYAKLLET